METTGSLEKFTIREELISAFEWKDEKAFLEDESKGNYGRKITLHISCGEIIEALPCTEVEIHGDIVRISNVPDENCEPHDYVFHISKLELLDMVEFEY